jgi:acyl dehydratase
LALTEHARSLIGTSGPRLTAAHPLGEEELRRFTQAVMNTDPIHHDEQAAAARYGGVVAPALYPVHAFRRPAGSPDPFDRLLEDPDWDGTDVSAGLGGLPPLELPFSRVLNGGVQAEFHRLARVGDVISAQASYADIQEREGRSGAMVLVTVETTYTNQDDAVLARVRSTVILR